MTAQDDLENDVDNSDASGDLDVAANDAMPPAMTSSMKMPAPGTAPPDWKQYLQNKQEQLAAAQKQASNNEMLTGLARAGASLSAGLARSNAPVNEAPFNAMAATDQQPVTDVLNAQKSAAQDISTQSSLVDAQKKIGDSDPNSPQSIAYKEQIKRLYPGKFDDATLATLSKADIGDSIMKPLELDEKIQAHKEEMRQRGLDRSALTSSKKADKDAADHEKYVQHIEDSEKSWRSDPASMRYDAMLSATASGKAMIDKYRGHEDDMPLQDIHALVSDRLKAITGATPTEAEIEAQMPHTGQTKYSGIKSWVTGSMQPANAGDFVRNIDSGFQDMEKTARAGLQHRQQSVASSPRLTSDERDRLTKIGVPEPAYNSGGAPPPGAHSLDDLLAEKARRAKGGAAAAAPEAFAFGGTVQAPGFQHIHQQIAPHLAMPKQMAMPKAPVAHIPVGMAPTEAAQKFAGGGTVQNYQQGGTVPGQPNLPFNSPANDTVNAKLTPKEEVLPISVTQSKAPALAAYMHMKSKGYK